MDGTALETIPTAPGPLLYEWFDTEHARTGLLTLAAHGTLGPQVPGSAYFAFVQAIYHRYGNWHACGGSGALAAASHISVTRYGSQPAYPDRAQLSDLGFDPADEGRREVLCALGNSASIPESEAGAGITARPARLRAARAAARCAARRLARTIV